MTIDSRIQILKTVRERSYLAKDFNAIRADLLNYARIHFGNKIRDFSEAGLGGLLLELVSYVGDVNSFYLDHQFHELSIESAVEPRNIERLIRDAGVKITGSSPAVVNVIFAIQVPADRTTEPRVPLNSALPILETGTIVQSQNGIQFELIEDLDFSDRDNAGNLKATIVIGDTDVNNNPETFILTLTGVCVSGNKIIESFSLGSFEPFKKITLGNENITEIVSVKDALGNEYYEVESLTHDTVFKAILNRNEDNDLVKDNLMVVPAPYRFISQTSYESRLTTLIFGSGNAETIDDDIVPDPSEFALPLFGKRTFSRFTLNPGNLLRTSTLGVIAQNTTLFVEYRYGGGLNHNISAGSIRGVILSRMSFPNNPSVINASFVKASLDAVNEEDASGGDDAPTLDELKLQVPSARAAQGRIVSKQDLIARIYTMPSNFGRVYRASIRTNPNNPNAAQLFIISRNDRQQLVVSPDSLKKNLATYLNQFRLISDAIDILDAQVINIKIEFSVVMDPTFNKNIVLQNVIQRLKEYFSIKNFEVDQPIILADINNIIYNNLGILSVQTVRVINISGTQNGRNYSDIQYDIQSNTIKNIVFPPTGGIFSVKYLDHDLIGASI